MRTIERPVQVDFLVASSYGDGKVSSGTVRLLYDPETRLEGKHILLVEDIIDTGKTLQRLMALLADRKPRSLAICALLDKQLAAGAAARSSGSSASRPRRRFWSDTDSTTPRTTVISRSSRTWNKWQTDSHPGPRAPTGAT